MKIRTDFVTNSSSTSFVIITEEELTFEVFLDLMGVDIDSPFKNIFVDFYENIQDKKGYFVDDQDSIEAEFLPYVKSKIEKARSEGKYIHMGYMASDSVSALESFFCTDSFEIEKDNLFFSAWDCAW